MPYWLPASAATPPMVLVASPEAGGVLALNSYDGSIVWCQVLPEPSTGQLLVVANRVFVSCRGGTVFEIDVVSGRRLGCYDLGVELTQGGVLQPGTDNVFFAADRGCVLRWTWPNANVLAFFTPAIKVGPCCPPVILPMCRGESIDGSQANPSLGQLLLCQQDGLGKTALQCYLLPVTNSHVPALPLGDKLTGRIEQAPVCNPEHFSLITDAGAFAVYGLRQRDNHDAEIFPMLAPDSTSQIGLGSSTYENAGRPMIVHADGQNFWIAAHGRLHHLQIGMSTQDGWKIIARSLALEPLGFPLQPAQVVVDEQGRTVVYLVTEAFPFTHHGGNKCRRCVLANSGRPRLANYSLAPANWNGSSRYASGCGRQSFGLGLGRRSAPLRSGKVRQVGRCQVAVGRQGGGAEPTGL